MGLDITAYGGCKKVDVVFNYDRELIDPATRKPLDGVVIVRPNSDFPGREEPFQKGDAVSFSDEYDFYAGSYSTHSAFRNALASMAGVDVSRYTNPKLPFHELICFSDCVGVIGTKACVELLKDFREHREAFIAMEPDWDWLYDGWLRAFEVAASGGFIDFH